MQIPGQGFWGIDVAVILRLAAPLQPHCSLSQEVDVRLDFFCIFWFHLPLQRFALFCVFPSFNSEPQQTLFAPREPDAVTGIIS